MNVKTILISILKIHYLVTLGLTPHYNSPFFVGISLLSEKGTLITS